MSEIKHTPTPWGLCYHLRSPEHDAACTCGYRGSIWSADGEHIVLEMGSSPDIDETGSVQGHTQPQADRPTQLADAALIVEAVNSHASLTQELNRLREALTNSVSLLDQYFSTFGEISGSNQADIEDYRAALNPVGAS